MIKKSNLPATKKVSLNRSTSKKQMQLKLKDEIDRIDYELKKLGIDGTISYKCNAIQDIETLQNNINISGMKDINKLLRFLSYYENLKVNTDKYIKEFKNGDFSKQGVLNVNAVPIINIIHDIVLRIKVVTNSTKINNLNAAKAKLMPFLNEDSRLLNTLKEVEQLYKEIE